MINKQEKGADGADLFLLTQYYLERDESVNNNEYVKKDSGMIRLIEENVDFIMDTFL